MRKLFALIFLLPMLAWAQSSLPPPPPKPLPSYAASVEVKSCPNSGDYYPRQSKRLNEAGTVVLRFFVEADGKLGTVEVERSSGYDRLDTAAQRLLQTCKFAPAMVQGKIARGSAKLEVVWRLDSVFGQSSLPACPASGWKSSCFGTITFPNGAKYVGEYGGDKRNGQGIEYRADGSVNRSGRWENNNFVESYALDANRFPFNPSSQVAAAPAVDPASAGPNWVLVAEATTGNKFYVNPSTIRRDGNLRRYWKFTDYASRQSTGVLSARTFEETDCREERRRTIEITGFSESMLQGRILGTERGDGSWDQIAPGTVAETVMRYVCAR